MTPALRRIQPQVAFVVKAPVEAVLWLKGEHGPEMQTAVVSALMSVFELPVSTPVRLMIQLDKVWELAEVQGDVPSKPSSDLVRGALIAAVSCSAVLLYGHRYLESNLPETAAPALTELN